MSVRKNKKKSKMGQTCCGPRTTSKAIKRLESSKKLTKGQVDKAAAEELWEIYVGKDAKETDFTTLNNSTIHSDYLTAQRHLIRKYVDEELTGYTEDEDGVKAMAKEKDMRKKRAKMLMDGINVHMNNDGTTDFVTKLFGMKKVNKKLTNEVNKKITKEEFIKRYCDSVKLGLQQAAGNQLDMESIEKEAAAKSKKKLTAPDTE